MMEIVFCNVGGTNVTAAGVINGHLGKPVRWKTAEFSTVDSLVDRLLKLFSPRRLAFAVAGPVLGGVSKLTNGSLVFSEREISARYGLQECFVVNDLVALASALKSESASTIRSVLVPDVLVLNVGTGFGGAIALGNGSVMGVEPGRLSGSNMSALLEAENIEPTQFPEYESVLSGGGLVKLRNALASQSKASDAATVFREAREGGAVSSKAVHVFFQTLGLACTDLSLFMPSCRKIVLSGGVLLKNRQAFECSIFLKTFLSQLGARSNFEPPDVCLLEFEEPELIGLLSLFQSDYTEKIRRLVAGFDR